MSRIFVMGYELPSMARGTTEARSYRTWQFVEPLIEDGHEICFIASHTENQFNVPHHLPSVLRYHRLNLQQRSWLTHASALFNDFEPNAILGVMFNNGLRATRLPQKLPLWIDLYGDRMSEAQIAAHTSKSNRGRRIMFEYINIILRNADKISTCSAPQKYAVVGQLGMASRINRDTMGYEFVHTVLPGASSHVANVRREIILRGEIIPEDAFVVLWCGGYNVWTDVDTLYKALNRAMDMDPRIHYVSAGASVRLNNNNSYERLVDMISRSPHHDRFHMLGWQPSSAIPGLYGQADVGVNLDAFHYETELGTRTRLVEMMHYGLPVITTLGCELSYIIEQQGLGLTFQIGDAETFSNHILAMAKDRPFQQRLAQQAQSYTNNQLSFRNTTSPFLAWAHAPRFAPDRVQPRTGFDVEEIKNHVRGGVRSLLWRFWALERGD